MLARYALSKIIPFRYAKSTTPVQYCTFVAYNRNKLLSDAGNQK